MNQLCFCVCVSIACVLCSALVVTRVSAWSSQHWGPGDRTAPSVSSVSPPSRLTFVHDSHSKKNIPPYSPRHHDRLSPRFLMEKGRTLSAFHKPCSGVLADDTPVWCSCQRALPRCPLRDGLIRQSARLAVRGRAGKWVSRGSERPTPGHENPENSGPT